jgi:hypothetical protein
MVPSRRSFHGGRVALAVSSLVSVVVALLPHAARGADREERRQEREARRAERREEWREERERSALDLGFDAEGAGVLVPPRPVSGDRLWGGSGFKVRVGDQIRFPFLRFTPEMGYAYVHLYAANDLTSPFGWDTHRLFAGVRLGLGEIIVHTFYGHVGYGWRRTGDPTVPSADGLAFDTGVALDLHLIPHFGFGAHVEYAMIDSVPYTPHWLGIGLHADLAF